MMVKDLIYEENGDFYRCPNCGDYDMQELMIWDDKDDEGIGTGHYVCGSCSVDYQANDDGVLVGAPDYLELSMNKAKEDDEKERAYEHMEKIAEQESKWGEPREEREI